MSHIRLKPAISIGGVGIRCFLKLGYSYKEKFPELVFHCVIQNNCARIFFNYTQFGVIKIRVIQSFSFAKVFLLFEFK
jgi:hypothetical protein